MDNYREKIVRIVERELKRTEEYQQRRDEYGNEEYILGCIMVKGDAFPKEVIAHAFVEDMGLELQFQIWRDEPRIRQKQAMWYDLTLFDVERDFFGRLEQGYSILSVSDLFHCTAWSAMGPNRKGNAQAEIYLLRLLETVDWLLPTYAPIIFCVGLNSLALINSSGLISSLGKRILTSVSVSAIIIP